MTPTWWRERGTLVPLALVTVFTFRLALASAVIPPWQIPDEPQHVAIIQILLEQGGWNLGQRRDARIEAKILASMADHDWWRHYGDATPDPLPADFMGMTDHIWPAQSTPPVYYLVATGFLRALGTRGLMDQYYALRWLSGVIAVLTLLVAWKGTRTLFGDEAAAGSTALLALHPQFAVMSIGSNPAVLVHLFAAVIWWQAGRLLTGKNPALSMATVGAATLLEGSPNATLLAVSVLGRNVALLPGNGPWA